MSTALRLSESQRVLVRCPACRSAVSWSDRLVRCRHETCGLELPILDGIPVLLNEARSVFSVADFRDRRSTTFDLDHLEPRRRSAWRRVREFAPDIGMNWRAEANYRHLSELLPRRGERPRALILGGGIAGLGLAGFLADPSIECIESDVSFGPRTRLICDAHDIPFADDSFDVVIAQAVLEHVVDPSRCVEEIHRVTKADGLVYAETPFIQQVHMGKYDFTRFTQLGHRRLFRRYEELASGAVGGPGMALAWSYCYFLMSLARSRTSRALASRIGRFTSFWLKYLDKSLLDRPAALDAASCFYFMGRKTAGYELSDRELLRLYRGPFQAGSSAAAG